MIVHHLNCISSCPLCGQLMNGESRDMFERGQWRVYGEGGESWHGFEGAKTLEGLPPSILLVPLRGHTLGHAGIAVETPRGWLLDAADAYFDAREMALRPRCHPGLRLYQWMLEKDRAARLANQAALRRLAAARPDIGLFSSHDPVEFERLAGRALDVPAKRLR